ncbi:hypothetical protein JTB14_011388 [Gonioctena quinquepunctata]|nr:hypothetical protein JTB14_011388 [Gonioctena quinquepunctata]
MVDSGSQATMELRQEAKWTTYAAELDMPMIAVAKTYPSRFQSISLDGAKASLYTANSRTQETRKLLTVLRSLDASRMDRWTSAVEHELYVQ